MLPKYIGQSSKYYLLYEVARKLDQLVKLAPNGNWGKETAEKVVTKDVTRVQEAGGVVESPTYLATQVQELKEKGFWDQASAVWIPSGYAEGKLYAVKGGAAADFGFTRAGTRTRVGPSGLVEEVPYNFIVTSNGPFVGNGTEVSTNYGTITPTGLPSSLCTLGGGGNQGWRLFNSIPALPSTEYTLSFYIRRVSGNGWFRTRIDDNVGAS